MSMDKLWSCIIQIHLLFLIQYSSFLFLSSAYAPPEKYFINCGSKDNFTDSGRTFVGDISPSSFSLSATKTSVEIDTNSSPNASVLYQSARIFRSPSSYKLGITENGTYLVRFHFFAFVSTIQLQKALFDVSVSASGSSLLQNFTVQNNSKPDVVKEFFLSIDSGEFEVTFTPGESSFAFVNAIEVFLCPDGLIPNNALQVSPAGSTGHDYLGLLSGVLQTVRRINVGGDTIAASGDMLWRYWVPDDPYLYAPSTAKNCTPYSGSLSYQTQPDPNGATEYTATDSVYKTAKEMNINSSSNSDNNLFNITWRFNVIKHAKHLVRVHFCDIISISINDAVVFDLFIYSNYSEKIDPYNMVTHDYQPGTPLFIDYVVDSDDSGVMNVSVGPRRDAVNSTVFLNGLEIMQIIGVSTPGSSGDTGSKKVVFIVVGSVIGGLALICIFVAIVLLVLKRRKCKPVETTSVWTAIHVHKEGSSHATSGSPVVNLNLGLKISFAELQSATKNFNKKLIIGRGGFGNVYSGKLSSGTKVAVKRSLSGSGQGLPEFHTEINILSRIRHRHLVSLIGYCDEGSEMILVYEFMANGTLRDHIYNSNLPCLSWKQRLEICIGAAKGLQYLHKGSAGGIIHRDVKSTNILLDENYAAKVADFGLSKSGPNDELSHVLTGIKGTFGYLDPDYFRSNQLTEKSDVYSFGVVLLEVLCARSPLDRNLPREQVNLADWGLLCKKNGSLDQIVDPLIKDQINPNSLRKFGEVAVKCLQENGSDRPTMSDVLWDLEYALQLQQSAGHHREPHEDSAIDGSSTAFAVPNIQRFPSMSLSFVGDDDATIVREAGSDTTESEVFSQLKIDDAR